MHGNGQQIKRIRKSKELFHLWILTDTLFLLWLSNTLLYFTYLWIIVFTYAYSFSYSRRCFISITCFVQNSCFIRHSFKQLKKNPTSYHVVVREFKTQWGIGYVSIQALFLMFMVMCEDIPKDTSIYKSAHEIRDNFLFDCRMSRYGEQYNTTAECSFSV